MCDEEIIALYFDRNERAIQASMDTYGNYCTRIARNILNDHADAEEIVADTWLHAWNAIPPSRPQYLHLFLGRITRNLSISRWGGNMSVRCHGILFLNLPNCMNGVNVL